MKRKSYTFFIAANNQSNVLKVRIPGYVLHFLALLAIVGGITTLAAFGAYSRMLWKVTNYNTLLHQQNTLKQQYQQLQATVQDTNERLSSLQSLASEVAMSYGFMRFRRTPFGLDEVAPGGAIITEASYEQTVEQFNFLKKNATSVALASGGLQLMPQPGVSDLASTTMPSLWPVIGRITGSFGERLDPFSGEGAFHSGVDISSDYGNAVHCTADGIVVAVEIRAGYGRLVIVDHGFGLSTWYGHLSSFGTEVGSHVKRGDPIGYVGVSGRVTGPHVHYEVRIHGAPVNPWRYLRAASSGD
jgi:murein DD-endopeptidase MepM/ murein hydrolase activator NlpD